MGPQRTLPVSFDSSWCSGYNFAIFHYHHYTLSAPKPKLHKEKIQAEIDTLEKERRRIASTFMMN